MEQGNILLSVILLLAVAGIVVITFKKMNLSPVLGYLVSGSIIGDYGFGIVTYSDTELIAECGIVFLLFAIGLELSFERLRALRKYVFGLGSLQITVTGLIIAGIASIFQMKTGAAVIVGASLALSSTAIVMQIVEETKGQATQVGRVSLAILLQQDFAVMPLFVLVTILSQDNTENFLVSISMAFLKAVGVLIVIFAIGRLVLRPVFKLISSNSESANNEIFIASTILIALSAAYGTQAMGLSMALGAFVAGILVAETEFRTAAEESIHPFKGLFLGMFFMSIGMKLDVMELSQNITNIFTLSCGLILLKAMVIAGLCTIFGFGRGMSIHIGFLLAQGGEFAFIIFKLCADKGILSDNTA